MAREAEGRRKLVSSRFLSDEAAKQGTHKRRSGQSARRNARRKLEKELRAEQKYLCYSCTRATAGYARPMSNLN